MLSSVVSVASGALQSVGSLVGMRSGTEEPAYVVEQQNRHIEVRRYSERVAAETTVTGGEEATRNAGFRRLAGYIFGGNHAKAKFAMTSPVTQSAAARTGQRIAMTASVAQQSTAEGPWVIRFFLPAGTGLAALPEPDDPAVRLVLLPAETVAVHRFSGDRGGRAVAAHTGHLLNALKDMALEPAGTPQAWFYDPPWTIPLFRRNEIAVPVRKTN